MEAEESENERRTANMHESRSEGVQRSDETALLEDMQTSRVLTRAALRRDASSRRSEEDSVADSTPASVGKRAADSTPPPEERRVDAEAPESNVHTARDGATTDPRDGRVHSPNGTSPLGSVQPSEALTRLDSHRNASSQRSEEDRVADSTLMSEERQARELPANRGSCERVTGDGVAILEQFQKLEDRVDRRIWRIRELLRGRDTAIVVAEVKLLEQHAYDMQRFSGQCVDRRAAEASERAEERVFDLKASVSSWIRDLEERRSTGGRSVGSHTSRESRQSGVLRRNDDAESRVAVDSAARLREEARIAATAATFQLNTGVQRDLEANVESTRSATRRCEEGWSAGIQFGGVATEASQLADTSAEVLRIGDPLGLYDLTGGGADHHQAVLLKRFLRLEDKINRRSALVQDLLTTRSAEMMNAEMQLLDQHLFELKQVGLQCVDPNAEDTAEAAEDRVFQLKVLVSTRLKELEETRSSSGGSGYSQKSRSSGKSVASRRSHGSRRSARSASSIGSDASISNQAKIAALKAKAGRLTGAIQSKVEAEVERIRFTTRAHLEKEIEKLNLDIAAAEASQQIYDRDPSMGRDDHLSTSRHDHLSPKPVLPAEHTRCPDPRVGDTKVQGAYTSNPPPSRNLGPAQPGSVVLPLAGEGGAESIIEMLQLSSAPGVDLDVFSGDPLDYEYFRASFRDAVESKVKEQRSKLMRLIKYTSGEAKELIKEYVHESDGDCFDRAISALEKEYGDPHKLDSAYMRELRQWPSIRQNDAKAYRRMNRFLQKCQIGRRQGRLVTLDTPETIRLILSKYHLSIQESWNKLVVDKGCPVFSELVAFLERKSKLISNPMFSRDAYTEKDKGVIAGSLKTFATGLGTEDSTGSTSTTPLFSPNCVYCKAKHWVENCDRLEKMPPGERFEVLTVSSVSSDSGVTSDE